MNKIIDELNDLGNINPIDFNELEIALSKVAEVIAVSAK